MGGHSWGVICHSWEVANPDVLVLGRGDRYGVHGPPFSDPVLCPLLGRAGIGSLNLRDKSMVDSTRVHIMDRI